jgi:DNA-binding transcriptional regulator YiaG
MPRGLDVPDHRITHPHPLHIRSPDLADINRLFKEEIARLARKEIRAEIEHLKKASSQYRTDIAALKRQVAELEKQLGRAARRAAAAAPAIEAPADNGRHRFSAKGLKSLRARLEFSAAEFAQLLGVSAQTIYNWEAETTRPRAEQIAALIGLRSIGKKEARARIAAAPAE